ncbi:cob(I)yrinic acid a,c-diamide adenosyltransferase [Glaciecola sp. 1036]|uniref:cob(I)yrinic acid a,c-diamide adenosyltransferase n=1 Tax=Alteromonadaceae TaxID=72275 RepID=UPI003D019FCB
MKIYTKQGDAGQTSVYTSQILKVDKDHVLLDTYGSFDELNANVGLAIAQLVTDDNKHKILVETLTFIQNSIFNIGFALSDEDKLTQDMIERLEFWIDEMSQQLAPLTSFILPGGSITAAQLHVCRTIARRAERHLVSLKKNHSINPLALAFTNRLSDYFFVAARFVNMQQNKPDIKVAT